MATMTRTTEPQDRESTKLQHACSTDSKTFKNDSHQSHIGNG